MTETYLSNPTSFGTTSISDVIFKNKPTDRRFKKIEWQVIKPNTNLDRDELEILIPKNHIRCILVSGLA